VVTIASTRIGVILVTKQTSPLASLSPADLSKLLSQWSTGGSPVLLSRLLPLLLVTTVRTLLRAHEDHSKAIGFDDQRPLKELSNPSFVQLTDLTVGSTNTTVAIVGSGVGGSGDNSWFCLLYYSYFWSTVTALHLARSKTDSIVIEQGEQHNPTDQTYYSGYDMYERNGTLSTEAGNMSILTARTVGGGSVVNWCASFRTPEYVLREWREEFGLHFAGGSEYQAGADELWKMLGIHESRYDYCVFILNFVWFDKIVHSEDTRHQMV
jgi:hypothetical protein